MASLAQIEANRRNAKRSTGPRTPEGKVAGARNGVLHGLASSKFALLPWEDPADWDQLLSGLVGEHQPSTPTEEFLVMEMARAQWKLNRIAHIEHEILAGQDGATDWAELALQWRRDCANSQKVEKLERYETSLRRAWYRALDTLTRLRKPGRSASKPSAPCAMEEDKAKPIREEAAVPRATCNPQSLGAADSNHEPCHGSRENSTIYGTTFRNPHAIDLRACTTG